MTAHVLISGTLFRAPEQPTAKSGKPILLATARAKEGDSSQFWRVIAISENVQAELIRLADGDAMSGQGSLRAETYRAEGGENEGFPWRDRRTRACFAATGKE